jgi:hypothetical protein
MAVFEFPCPVCSLTLRARDQSVAGRTIVCADCETQLLVELDGDGQLFARQAQDISPLSTKPAGETDPLESPSPQFDPLSPQNSSGIPRRWLLGLGLAIVVLATFYSLGRRDSVPADKDVTLPPEVADEKNSDPPNPEPPSDPKQQPVDDDNGLYAGLNRLIKQYQQEQGVFPAPPQTALEDPNQRLSWIANLEATLTPNQLPPLWDRPWNDPLNEHFVRRALPHYWNPAITQKTSPDKYPATHFVGLAGVGKDAASLPKSDPRAGMFGHQRTITVDDLTAGAANVWMISGVQDNIGSWAAHGRATIRPWTGGAVIGGPDGFGSGQKDSMSILMADGSVRTISANTHLKVLERLATIHDDRKPVIAKANPRPKQLIAKMHEVDQKNGRLFEFGPLQAPKPPEAALSDLIALLKNDLKEQSPVPMKNVEQQLSQKLLLFDLREPQPLRAVFDQIEEMTGVPIITELDTLGDAANRIEEPVTISLIEPTLKDVLENLLQRAKLGYRIVGGRIEITSEPLILIK